MSISAMFFLPLARWFARLPFFQSGDPVGQLVEMAQPRGVAHPGGVVVEREDPGIGSLVAERARDQRPGRDLDAVGDPDVPVDHRRAADLAVPPDVGAAGDAGARGDRGMRADAYVVADLDLVVELHSLLDHRVVERAAVDGGVRADLDVVADAYGADLRDLQPAPLLF